MDNHDRAEWGLRAIERGNPDHDDSIKDDDDGWRTTFVDTLANIMHAADLYGFEFDDALASARNHYSAERAGL